jgi:hypothetical protein
MYVSKDVTETGCLELEDVVIPVVIQLGVEETKLLSVREG